ncbi:hypothetical protein H5410_050061 [Solanum commersonii]|uniref:Peptidase A1 domain-containing protein n=1 Tax=Solanum commersonii TaxID=4109 RepID=A0A9J5WUI3_SOLCO|nr:hypothetical protein H5410_050061 [Solanum commersonii]
MNEVFKTEEEYYSSGAARVFHLESLLPTNHITKIDELVARDRARHARILRTTTSEVINFPLNNSFDLNLVGIYYSKVKVGSPQRKFKLLIDIKRVVSWISCNSCNNCSQTSELTVKLNFYDIGNSTTATVISYSALVCKCTRTKQCGYTLNYMDESRTTGYFVSNILHLDTILRTSLIANS